MTKKPKMYTNCCPMCFVPFEVAEVLRRLWDSGLKSNFHAAAVICTSCNHIIAAGPSDDGSQVCASEAPYQWFHDLPVEDQLRLHDFQEEEHHKRRHWG